MGVLPWIAKNWFDLLQTVGIVAGLIFTAYSVRKDEQSKKIANLIAITERHREIWKEFYRQPNLARVLEKDVNLIRQPITIEESLFVKLLILHLNTVHRALKAGVFVEMQGLGKDITGFFSSPIPGAIWENLKPLQDRDFIDFVESYLNQ